MLLDDATREADDNDRDCEHVCVLSIDHADNKRTILSLAILLCVSYRSDDQNTCNSTAIASAGWLSV